MANLKVLGGGREVGKSCIQLELDQHRFLIDCGIDPASSGRASLPDLSGMRLEGLDGIFVSHAHLDHTGGIPNLVRHGFNSPIYMTLPTLALLNLLWQDELSIMEREWPKEERIWSSKEMHRVMMKLVVPTTYHEIFKIGTVTANFHNAGHILGSTITELTHDGLRVVFSGDLGTSSNHLRYWRTEDFAYPDVLVCEGTYGGVNRKGREEVQRELLEGIRITLEEDGKVLIPMFAVGKTQEILKILKDGWNKLPDVDVYLEGMSIETLRVYEQFLIYMDDKVRRAFLFNGINPFRWGALRLFRSLAERKQLHSSSKPCIIMAPSGMLRGGWSVWHLMKMAHQKNNMVAICGHMEEGTPGYELIKGRRDLVLTDMISKVRQNVKVQCSVNHFELSAHAMHNELCSFISKVKPECLILVHGEPEALEALSESVKQHAGSIVIPANGERVDLKNPVATTRQSNDGVVEVPISGSTSIMLQRGSSVRVRHMGRERFMKADDLRSLARE